METSSFEWYWHAANRAREQGRRQEAVDLFTLAFEQLGRAPLVAVPQDFSNPRPKPSTLEEYRAALDWYRQRFERFRWTRALTKMQMQRQRETLDQYRRAREERKKLYCAVSHTVPQAPSAG